MTTETTNEKLDFKRILPVLVIVLVDLMGLSIIIPLLPLYAARFGSSPLVIGILQATYPMMQFLGAPILGRLSDRFGRKPILVVSQIGTLIGFIMLGFANSLLLLFISRIIDGLSGANISTAQAAIADSTTEKTRTQGLGLVGAAFGIGFVLGPILAFIVLAATGQNYQAVAFTAAFFSLASILLTLFWFKETYAEVENPEASRKRRPFSFGALREALSRPSIGFLLILMFFYQIAFGGYEQLFSLFTLTRLGMDARDTSGLFVLAGLFIIVVQGGLIGRWSKQKGDRWLVLMGIGTLAIGLIGTALTPAVPIPWYEKAKVLESMAGQGEFRVSIQSINIQLPDEAAKGWLGIIWLLLASFPAALGGGVLQPAVNSLITKASDKNEVGGMLGASSAAYSAANAIAPLFYGALFQWFGGPVPFFAGGLILAIMWLLAPRVVKA
ncbi:MAG TPA: MFS transporter [Anaerolineales bacterium]|nr:MFS transporter [Anaerolineales bacterium]HMV96947.1 MFS transporter [Anaerolineales bacterium]HMX18600.1 MFS transporter [Anaerolineales bacterium]HMX74590.1 MFS transporter [Anaerolineales bacterium]HMZ41504.1 MFS transporter [Anaerolineales bacterium]